MWTWKAFQDNWTNNKVIYLSHIITLIFSDELMLLLLKKSNLNSHISSVAKSLNVTVMPMFCGHGIGRYFHGLPDIYHFGRYQYSCLT